MDGFAELIVVPTENPVLVANVDAPALPWIRFSTMMSVLVSLLMAIRSCLRSRVALQLEVLALRHQLHLLNRSRARRLGLSRADRRLWVWLSHVWNDWRSALVIV